ncbi:hypothetical protein A3K86_04340 [Photobacterium jeanii]|uniref:DUF2799 domain-containing protein n=1 Tax=Photobacterium jeanii TaxID=858640 RepID=A0A178KLJ5_9GAMM|nr:DUF2799 domain-containing protein [Photobacterium jeanii]OAN18137.1 hypothetical protein A3K86_04340 [Photobacterium jeanii]PST92187.1 DUF2799 domain-containing protein [Photobacterium jeanii]
MKKWILSVVVGLVLSGCALQPDLAFKSDDEWKEYGYEVALAGMIKDSEQNLKGRDTLQSLQSASYQAYSDGYELGRKEYCSQNAVMLGVKNEPYRGICDKLDWTFRQDYINGRTSRAGRGF